MRKRRLLVLMVALVFLLACGSPAGPTPMPTPLPTLASASVVPPPTPTSAPTPSLLAMLVGKEGKVEVAQPIQATYRPARLGMQLQGGDGVKTYPQSMADIFCQDGSIQHVDAEREEMVACRGDTGLSPQLYEPLERAHDGQSSLVLPPRENPADYGHVPVLLSPRNTKLLTSTPTFRWTTVDGAKGYTIIVKSPAGEVWCGETDQTELAYPADAPALTDGITYLLSVEAQLGAAVAPRVATEAIYLSILAPPEAEEIQALEEELKASPLGESSQRFILATLYAKRGLYHAAITTYEALVADNEQAVYYCALGDLYVQIKLYRSAQEHYARAVELAVADGDKMGQAVAEAGLGRAYHGYGNAGEALTHLRVSLALYEELGEMEQVERLSDLITRVQGE
jgi:hypothetical protein